MTAGGVAFLIIWGALALSIIVGVLNRVFYWWEPRDIGGKDARNGF